MAPLSTKCESAWKTLPVTQLPNRPFYYFEPQNQEIGDVYVVQERWTTDFEAPKLSKGRSGTLPIHLETFFFQIAQCFKPDIPSWYSLKLEMK